jgi:hypothetical protein
MHQCVRRGALALYGTSLALDHALHLGVKVLKLGANLTDVVGADLAPARRSQRRNLVLVFFHAAAQGPEELHGRQFGMGNDALDGQSRVASHVEDFDSNILGEIVSG